MGWQHTFYMTPLFIPCAALLALGVGASKGSSDVPSIIRLWLVGAPVGFAVWLVAWNVEGSGLGQISPFIGWFATTAWVVWMYGTHLAYVRRDVVSGILTVGLVATLLLLGVSRIDRGTAPLKLVLLCASALEGILLLRIYFARYLRNDTSFRADAVTVWRFLNRRIVFESLASREDRVYGSL